MSYQVIARKWRPQTFEEVTGQEVITQTLRNALEFDRLHHAYLFSGSRGVGKTTTARILAKALNCHKTDGKPNLTPCLLSDPGICPSCIEISEGRSIDVLEIDAASHTGIDDVRETILESINFNPARDRFKVFIIDEVHQLSKPAFNALLKTLEEPPDNTVFIMATTELHKVPETILSRCQEFEFRTIPLPKIFDRLKLIADAEKINISDDALRELARSGEGSMRDAQSNFDQVISFSSDEITADNVTKALGFAGVETLSKVIKAISEKNAKGTLDVVDDLIGRGHDLRNFCRDLLGLFRDLLVFKVAGESPNLHESALFSVQEMRTASEPFTEADLLRFFNALAETETKLKGASHSRHILEIGLIRLIEMRRVVDLEGILERLSAIESDAGSGFEAASAQVQEKKTLISAPTIEQEPIVALVGESMHAAPVRPIEVDVTAAKTETEFPEQPPDRDFELDEPPEDMAFYDEPIDLSGFIAVDRSSDLILHTPKEANNESIAPANVRLAALTSEELEHAKDEKLDDVFEEKLTYNGDDLRLIPTAQALVGMLVGAEYVMPVRPAQGNGNKAVATAPKRDMSHLIPDIGRKKPRLEVPTLPKEATDDDLLMFANSHPTVHEAKRIFRATVIEAKRT